jgi:hypothetical protein
MTSSAASAEDFEFHGMWLRMWSSVTTAIRLLMAPRAAADVGPPDEARESLREPLTASNVKHSV